LEQENLDFHLGRERDRREEVKSLSRDDDEEMASMLE
jgi:hypothetical protein